MPMPTSAFAVVYPLISPKDDFNYRFAINFTWSVSAAGMAAGWWPVPSRELLKNNFTQRVFSLGISLEKWRMEFHTFQTTFASCLIVRFIIAVIAVSASECQRVARR